MKRDSLVKCCFRTYSPCLSICWLNYLKHTDFSKCEDFWVVNIWITVQVLRWLKIVLENSCDYSGSDEVCLSGLPCVCEFEQLWWKMIKKPYCGEGVDMPLKGRLRSVVAAPEHHSPSLPYVWSTCSTYLWTPDVGKRNLLAVFPCSSRVDTAVTAGTWTVASEWEFLGFLADPNQEVAHCSVNLETRRWWLAWLWVANRSAVSPRTTHEPVHLIWWVLRHKRAACVYRLQDDRL